MKREVERKHKVEREKVKLKGESEKKYREKLSENVERENTM